MIYLSQLLGIPVYDSADERIGVVNDLGIATGEVFPRVTSLAFVGPGKTPIMISWRKYVDSFDEEGLRLKVPATDIRFSYLQPNEVLMSRDLLNKQIVDTQGMKVVRVNDLKLSDYGSNQLRLLGAEVGARGLLRSLSPLLERAVLAGAKLVGKSVPEQVIAWNYMDLIDRDLSDVKLSVTHKTLDELHPADVADIIEQLDPRLRGQVFAQLDQGLAAEAMAELDDDGMAAQIVEEMDVRDASRMLSEMDPDDAADLVSELGHDAAERLLRLMGVQERRAIYQLLGYRENTAGRIMTQEFVACPPASTVADAIARIGELGEDFESVRYVYTLDEQGRLKGAVTLRQLLTNEGATPLDELAECDLVWSEVDDDQENVAMDIAKYNLLAMPVVDDDRRLLGIVTVDDALDVLQEEHAEDLRIADGSRANAATGEPGGILARLLTSELWFFFWLVAWPVLALLSQALVGSALPGMVAGSALPLALHVSDSMVRYATSFFIEFDADDEDAPSVVGFALRGVGVSVLFAAVAVLLARGGEAALVQAGIGAGAAGAASAGAGAASAGASGAASAGAAGAGVAGAAGVGAAVAGTAGAGATLTSLVMTGFLASAAVVVLSFASAPIYLVALRRRDAADRETSGIVLRIIALLVAAALFCAIALVLLGASGLGSTPVAGLAA